MTMPRISMTEFRSIAAQLGHADLSVQQTPAGSKWFAICSCGYRSTNKFTVELATGSAVHHFELVARKYAASGATVTATDALEEAS